MGCRGGAAAPAFPPGPSHNRSRDGAAFRSADGSPSSYGAVGVGVGTSDLIRSQQRGNEERGHLMAERGGWQVGGVGVGGTGRGSDGIRGVKLRPNHFPSWFSLQERLQVLLSRTGGRGHRSGPKGRVGEARMGGWGWRPNLLRNSPLLPLTSFPRAAGITELKASRHGRLPSPSSPFSFRGGGLPAPALPLPPPFMPIKQPIGTNRHGGQCTAQRRQHVCVCGGGCCTAERTSSARLRKTRVGARGVARLLTFAAQQSMLQMRTQTIKVIYGGGVCVRPL